MAEHLAVLDGKVDAQGQALEDQGTALEALGQTSADHEDKIARLEAICVKHVSEAAAQRECVR